MRVLFSCTATEGHVAPLVPLARAFAELGHDVAFATAPVAYTCRFAHVDAPAKLPEFA